MNSIQMNILEMKECYSDLLSTLNDLNESALKALRSIISYEHDTFGWSEVNNNGIALPKQYFFTTQHDPYNLNTKRISFPTTTNTKTNISI